VAPELMDDQAAAFGAQLRAAAGLARGALAGVERPRQVVACALGGSAAGARLAAGILAAELAAPVEVVSAAALPGYVGPGTLAVCISYSGNTRETLVCFGEAIARGATITAVTSGGALAERARAAGARLVEVEGGYAPRGALGLLLAPLLVLLHEAGVAPDPTDLIAAGADAADAVHAAPADAAAAAARSLGGRVAVLYGAGARAAAAVRIKNQINENAKAAAFGGAVPEIAHNEVLAWHGAKRHGQPLAAIFLRDDAEPPLERALLDEIQVQLAGDTDVVLEWRGQAADEPSRLFGLLAFGDRVSLELARVEGVDAMDIARLGLLKETLSRV